MKAATVAENRPVFNMRFENETEYAREEHRKTHEYEDSICISLPTLSNFFILFLRLREVHRPEPIRRVSIFLVWDKNEITTCETEKG